MGRFKLFLFYQFMAVSSLFKPASGRDMIACAELGARKKIVEELFRTSGN